MDVVSQLKRIIIYALRLFHLNPPLANRPAQTGASGPILRL